MENSERDGNTRPPDLPIEKPICRLALSHVQLIVTLCIIQSMEFSRPEYWRGQPFPSPGDLPNPGIEPRSPALQADSLPAEPQGKPYFPKFLNNYNKLFEPLGYSFIIISFSSVSNVSVY